MRHFGKVFIFLIALHLVAGLTMAQATRGEIRGKVVDEAGAGLPGVTVTLSSSALQGAQSAVTGSDGTYSFLALPPGEYAVNFSLPGFQGRSQEDMRVSMGATTRVDAIMTPAFSDEVVVTSESPLVNTADTTVGVDLSSDFYESLPTGRNYTSVASVTPGAQADDSGQTFYGSTGAENSYYIDGANTTGIEFGTQGTQLNFEFIDEVQVKTGSYNAEFGRATGSVINVVTKSGGNEFHGDVFGYYDADSLQASLKAAPDTGAVNASFKQTSFTRSDYGLDLGGYIVKDKLWFFAAYDRVDNENNLEVLKDFSAILEGGTYEGEQIPQTTTGDLWAAKLTWRIAANHSVAGSVFGDPTTNDGVLAGQSLAATSLHFTGLVETGGTNYSLSYDGIFGQNIVVSARAAYHDAQFKQGGPGATTTGFVDLTDPLGDGTTVWGWDADGNAHQRTSGFGNFNNNEFGRNQYNADMSWFVGNLAGSHEFKFGVEWEDISINSDAWEGGNGQRVYRFDCIQSETRDCQGQPYYFRHRFFVSNPDIDPETVTTADMLAPQLVDTISDNGAYYVQDTWQVANNLSLSLGVRFGQQRLYNADREVSADINDNIAPRLGFVWDFTGNGKSKLFGHWGKFYEAIPMDIVIRSFGGEISLWSYNLSDNPDDLAADLAVRGSRVLGGGFSRVDPGIKGQYLEESIVGAEYEFAPDWAVGAKYIVRDLKRVIEDALTLDGDYYIGNPSYGEMTETYTMATAWGYNYADPREIVTPERRFKGVELTMQKRFSHNYQFIASMLWSSLEGNYDGTFQAATGQLDPNLNSAYDYADFAVNNDGPLSNDIPYQFKFDGIYRFDFGLSTGISAYYRDGTPITAMGYSVDYNNWEFYLSDRGAFGRVDSQWDADLHFDYPFNLGSGVAVNVLLDIFSVFNNQGETLRDIQYTTAVDGQTYNVLDWDTNVDYPPITRDSTDRPPTNPGWNTANRWQNPTTVRLGLRLSF
jgi:hypothetical protein